MKRLEHWNAHTILVKLCDVLELQTKEQIKRFGHLSEDHMRLVTQHYVNKIKYGNIWKDQYE